MDNGYYSSLRLSKDEILNLVSPTGRTYKAEMRRAVFDLWKCIVKQIDIAYLGAPKVYKRTGALKNALTIINDISVRNDGNTLTVELFFDEGGIMRTPVMKNYKDKKVNVLKLLNYGFKHDEDSPVRHVKYFGWRPGAHFIEKGIEEFNEKYNPLGMTVQYTEISQNKNNYYI